MAGESEVNLRSVSWWMRGQGVYALSIAVGGGQGEGEKEKEKEKEDYGQ
jgi:hypothetical protein